VLVVGVYGATDGLSITRRGHLNWALVSGKSGGIKLDLLVFLHITVSTVSSILKAQTPPQKVHNYDFKYQSITFFNWL
jgi:hypothetical protein